MKDVREDLTAYVDGELSDARRREVEQAVGLDPTLQTEVTMLRRLKKSINPEPLPDLLLREASMAYDAPNPAKEELLRKLQAAPKPGGFRAVLRPYRWVAAGAVGVAMVATFVQMGGRSLGESSAGSKEVTSSPAFVGGVPSTMAEEAKMETAAPAAPGESETDAEQNLWKGADQARPAKRSAPSSAAADIPTLRNEREVIQSANIGVAVPDAYKGLNQVEAIALSKGGYLENKSFNRADGGMPTASAILKVPSAKYDAAMQNLRDLGEVREESQQADDVTKAAVAYRAEIDQLKRKINALDARLRTARGSEAREIRWRLTELQGQLTSQQVVSKRLAAETAISTIAVTLYEKDKIKLDPANANWSENVWNQATNNFGVVGRMLGAVAVNILVFSPIWLPFLIVVWLRNRTPKA